MANLEAGRQARPGFSSVLSVYHRAEEHRIAGEHNYSCQGLFGLMARLSDISPPARCLAMYGRHDRVGCSRISYLTVPTSRCPLPKTAGVLLSATDWKVIRTRAELILAARSRSSDLASRRPPVSFSVTILPLAVKAL